MALSESLWNLCVGSCGPYTTARTFVLPISRKAEPSPALTGVILQRSCRISAGRRPSTRSPSGLTKSKRSIRCVLTAGVAP
eukprot:5845556-Pyramimonas_sp.AAC.2